MSNFNFTNALSLSFAVIFLTVILLEFEFCECEICETQLPVVKRLMKEKRIVTLSPIGIKQCSKRCSLTTGCLSYNYVRSNLSCDLNFANETTDSLDVDDNYEYYNREEPPQVNIGGCTGFTCGLYSQCVVIHGYGPYCNPTHCDSPLDVSLATVSTGDNSIGTTRAYVCDSGYALIGSADITCKSDATWTSIQFECRDCGNPPDVSLATITAGVNSVGTTRTYVCNAGYAMIGSADITCQTDATWTSKQFECRDCGSPPSKDRATLSSGNNLVGTTRYYTCWAEHHTEGTTSITCQSDGQWSSSNLYCRPYRWPLGTYGLYKTTSGCPADGSSWEEGYRYHDTEDDNPASVWSGDIPGHMSGGFSNTFIRNDFCIRTSETVTSDDLPWQAGSYCLLKKYNCPSGFSEGSLYWDDENSDNANSLGGTVPDGSYGRNTRIYVCCRSDGSASYPLYLPTSTPFYLSRKGGSCQTVAGMNVVQESIRYDCDDDLPSDTSSSGEIPDYNDDPTNWNLIFCYYYK